MQTLLFLALFLAYFMQSTFWNTGVAVKPFIDFEKIKSRRTAEAQRKEVSNVSQIPQVAIDANTGEKTNPSSFLKESQRKNSLK